MGEDTLVSIKIIKNKFTGAPASYGFIHFDSDAAALMAMHKLNNKMIPHSAPPVRFQLNHASAKQSGTQYTEREYSVWVSDLPKEVTEEEFRQAFSSRFASLKTAKVFREKGDKVYGFVRFTDLSDQREALIHMNGFYGLSKDKPIRVTVAIPKRSLAEATNTISTTYSDMYDQNMWDQSAWTNYGYSQGVSHAVIVANNATSFEEMFDNEDGDGKDEDRLIEHSVPVNVDAMNTDYMNRSQEVWDSIEQDRWLYNLDNEEGILPNFKSSKKRSEES